MSNQEQKLGKDAQERLLKKLEKMLNDHFDREERLLQDALDQLKLAVGVLGKVLPAVDAEAEAEAERVHKFKPNDGAFVSSSNRVHSRFASRWIR
jgi:cellulose biosynthesis protein BcsQ